jgi:very-short-patch-repair endonuclease
VPLWSKNHGEAKRRAEPREMKMERRRPAVRVDYRREWRRQSTRAEAAFWELVRDRRLDGLKFRRQHALAGYIADFYCAEAALIVELDGPIHDERSEADAYRDSLIAERRITIMRIKNADLEWDPSAVLTRLRTIIHRRLTTRTTNTNDSSGSTTFSD